VDVVDDGWAAGRVAGRGIGRGVPCVLCSLSSLLPCKAGGWDGEDNGNREGDASRVPESADTCEPGCSGSENAATMSMSMA
jgi:hypothetical protein